MKFAVGFQFTVSGEPFCEIVKTYRDYIGEVYFSWPGLASGRPGSAVTDWQAQYRLECELLELRKMGIKLDLLLNGNCYGDDAVSVGLRDRVLSLLEYMEANGICPEIITTTSPFIAHVIREEKLPIEIRASVNMRIGTTQAMSYAAEYFDSFYLQRDFQRDLNYVRTVSKWANDHGKKICLLANSGCLRFCPSQTFHDNLISHSHEAEQKKNIEWNPHLCRSVFSDKNRHVEILKETWIRPEDIHKYEGLVDIVKLATRQHSHPRIVLGAYTSGKYQGNLLELFEPGFASQFFPFYIDNGKFPEDWFEKVGACSGGCTDCGYCDSVFKSVLCTYSDVM